MEFLWLTDVWALEAHESPGPSQRDKVIDSGSGVPPKEVDGGNGCSFAA
jgi:hypothetical protein